MFPILSSSQHFFPRLSFRSVMADKTGKKGAGDSRGNKEKTVLVSRYDTRFNRNLGRENKNQEGFEGMKYNSRVWGSIRSAFVERFPDCPYNTWESLKDRIEYLRKKYRKVKEDI